MTLGLIASTSPARLNFPTIHRLSNGLTIIAEQIPVDAINLSLWLNVGSAVETNEINGMAHFLEHMVFKGTPTLGSGEFEHLVEQRGAITNAATSQDYTHYHITTAPQDFAELAPLQVDVVLNALVPDEAFERERFVILEEIRRADDSPSRRTFQRSMQMAFDQLPYRRPVLGAADVIAGLTPQQMREFHRSWYSPPSITAVAVGNLPVEQLIETVAESFASAQPEIYGKGGAEDGDAFPAPTHSVSFTPHLAEFPYLNITRQEYVDEKLTQARLVMVWRVPGVKELHHTEALDVLSYILGYGRTARLVRDLREDRQLVSSISASNITYARQGIFYISAQMPEENLSQTEGAIAHHVHNLQSQPVSQEEIERVRIQVANRYIFGNETPGNRAGLYGYFQSLVGDLAPAIHYPSRISALTAERLQTAAQQYLTPDAYGVMVVRPGNGQR